MSTFIILYNAKLNYLIAYRLLVVLFFKLGLKSCCRYSVLYNSLKFIILSSIFLITHCRQHQKLFSTSDVECGITVGIWFCGGF